LDNIYKCKGAADKGIVHPTKEELRADGSEFDPKGRRRNLALGYEGLEEGG